MDERWRKEKREEEVEVLEAGTKKEEVRGMES